jgi:imidazoleglycerol-phosphate dehydratase
MNRLGKIVRNTKETQIQAELNLDGSGIYSIQTPLGFLNHMLESFCKHGLFDLKFQAAGDLQVDQHHVLEDCGIVLGQVFLQALGDKKGIYRSGFFVYPMDESLAVVAVDLSGRSFLQYEVTFKRRFCGDLDTDLLEDFFLGLSAGMLANLAVRMPYGRNDHHKIEAIFKALGKALRMACALDERGAGAIPSTKGVLS